MLTKMLFGGLLCSLGVPCLIVDSHADHFTTVTINGVTVTQTACTGKSVHECLRLDGNYASTVTISPISSGEAVAESLSDGFQDLLQLRNVRITATGSADSTIVIQRQHAPGPIFPPHKYYKVSASGDFGGTPLDSTTGNSICVSGRVRSGTNPYMSMGSDCSPPVSCGLDGCTNSRVDIYPIGTTTQILGNVGGNRTLRLEVGYTMNANTTFDLNGKSVLKNSTSPDPGPTDHDGFKRPVPAPMLFEELINAERLIQKLRELGLIPPEPPRPLEREGKTRK